MIVTVIGVAVISFFFGGLVFHNLGAKAKASLEADKASIKADLGKAKAELDKLKAKV